MLAFGFGSQRLAAYLTPRPVIGGRAWPRFICNDNLCEILLVLWMNTTFGMFSFWCAGSRQQNGRSAITITRLPSLEVFGVRQLSDRQYKVTKAIFDKFSHQDFCQLRTRTETK